MGKKKKTVSSVEQLAEHIESIFGGDVANDIIKSTRNILYTDGRRIVSRIRRTHPWEDKSGRLTQSLKTKKRGRLDVVLYSNDKKAKFLYFGTKWHWVRPKTGKSLAWVQGGQQRFSGGHKVSGVWEGKERRGRPFGVRSTNKKRKELYWFQRGWDKQRSETLNTVGKEIVKVFGL